MSFTGGTKWSPKTPWVTTRFMALNIVQLIRTADRIRWETEYWSLTNVPYDLPITIKKKQPDQCISIIWDLVKNVFAQVLVGMQGPGFLIRVVSFFWDGHGQLLLPVLTIMKWTFVCVCLWVCTYACVSTGVDLCRGRRTISAVVLHVLSNFESFPVLCPWALSLAWILRSRQGSLANEAWWSYAFYPPPPSARIASMCHEAWRSIWILGVKFGAS